MGLAAAMLLGLSKIEVITLQDGLGALLLVIAMAGLFLIRSRLLRA